MCGRYYIEISELEFKQIEEALARLPKSGEIYPTDTVPAMSSSGLSLMQWGFPRYDGKGVLINARSESVLEKPMFARPFASLRCLLPASYYFEWRAEGTHKTKYRMFQPGSHVLYLAGIAKDYMDGTAPKFVILTRPAAPGISFVHDRMPLIIPKDARDAWLHGDVYEATEAMSAADTGVEAVPA